MAYVPQQAWIQNATVRENILFGRTCRFTRYTEVLRACQLIPDLDILQAGDMTDIGERVSEAHVDIIFMYNVISSSIFSSAHFR